MGLIQGFCQMIKPADRSLNQLWEKGYEQRKLEKIFFGAVFSLIYIYRVSHRLEHIEGNS